MKKFVALTVSHVLVAMLGFAAGIYFLPILTAPSGPDDQTLKTVAQSAQFTGMFRRDLQDSDALHWGEGQVSIGPSAIILQGELAPGPDYKLYLSPQFVETEDDFIRLKSKMVRVGDVDTFHHFLVSIPDSVNPADYKAVVVWCESFGQFITAASYQ